MVSVATLTWTPGVRVTAVPLLAYRRVLRAPGVGGGGWGLGWAARPVCTHACSIDPIACKIPPNPPAAQEARVVRHKEGLC